MKILSAILCLFLTAAPACLVLQASPAGAQDVTVVPSSPEQIKLTYAPIVKAAAPAVVNIYTKHTVQGVAFNNPFINDPFFSQFFQQLSPMKDRVEQSLGSGFIVDDDGLIVTNSHVIKDADEIMVVLNDGREYSAKTVLVDQPSDLGLLRIDTKGAKLPTLKLAPSETLDVGDLVLAIGNPFGVGQTVTSGIVSALARSNTNINNFDFFIQTDAAINPGNSGGPLVGMDGTVVGVNSAIYSKSGGSLGIGFAIPAEMVKAVIAAEKSGQVTKRGVVRAWMGFTAQSMTSEIASSLGFDHPQGALVATVTPEGPAAKAGLKTGDVILGIGDHVLRDAEELRFRIATLPIGQKTSFKVRRAGNDMTLDFIADKPAEIPARSPVTITGKNPLEGATLINVSPAVIDDMGLTGQTDGVIVQSVKAGTIAARIGLQAGDGIISIGDKKVNDTSRIQSMIANPGANQKWVVVIRRNGQDQTVVLN